MNSLRFRGSVLVETCSAETTVPWITRMSSSASRTSGANSTTFWGVSEAHATTPLSLISRMRRPISSGFTARRRAPASAGWPSRRGSDAISSKIGSGSSKRVWRPSRFRHARPPIRPISAAVAGETPASIALAIIGSGNVKASISQLMSTSSGSRVRRDGTIATSSNP